MLLVLGLVGCAVGGLVLGIIFHDKIKATYNGILDKMKSN